MYRQIQTWQIMYIPPNPKLFLILKMTGRNRGSVAIFASHCPALQISRPRLDSVQADPPPPSPRFYTHGQPTSPGSWTNAQRPAKRPTWAADSMRVWGDRSRYPCTRWDRQIGRGRRPSFGRWKRIWGKKEDVGQQSKKSEELIRPTCII
jgi:hypothetical protein